MGSKLTRFYPNRVLKEHMMSWVKEREWLLKINTCLSGLLRKDLAPGKGANLEGHKN